MGTCQEVFTMKVTLTQFHLPSHLTISLYQHTRSTSELARKSNFGEAMHHNAGEIVSISQTLKDVATDNLAYMFM